MRTLHKLLMLVIGYFAASVAEFEDGTTVCDKCICLVANNTATVLSYDLLDCSRRNLLHMIDNWPERFDTNDPRREIVLSLSGNDITELQQLPATSATLVFSCRHCQLETLASNLFLDTPNVLRVDLSWNKLNGDTLSADVFRGQYHEEGYYASLPLDELDLGYNMLTHLSDDAFKYASSIRHLSLAHNALGQIIESTANALMMLVRLEYLDLSYTSLTDIDTAVFVHMDALQELFIHGNQFTNIPDAVFQTKSLSFLNLAENPIGTLNITGPLDRLHHLNVSSMPMLKSIQIDSFENVKSLRSLTSRNNTALEIFDLTLLKYVVFLQELDLSQSNLKYLMPPTDTDNDSAIQTRDEFELYANTLEVLLLRENPWHCDCDLQHVLKQVNFNLETEEDTRCETPDMFTSLHLSDLPHIDVCDLPVNNGPKNSIYEKPAFLRPRAITLTLLSVGLVVATGILIGLFIAYLKIRLNKNGIGFASPVRYTSVRDSTASAVYQQ